MLSIQLMERSRVVLCVLLDLYLRQLDLAYGREILVCDRCGGVGSWSSRAVRSGGYLV
jgi:hypothetical protein